MHLLTIRRNRHPNVRFICLLAAIFILATLLVAPLWIVAFPPLLDYPNHLARSFILIHLHDPALAFDRFFRSDWGLFPYLGTDALMAMFGRIFPIETAGRILLSVCALSIPAAATFFLRTVESGSEATALWSLILSYNVFLLEGFLNFDMGIAVGLAAIGFWLRWVKQPVLGRWLAALLVFTALYFTHLIAFGVVGFIVIAYLAFAGRPLRDWIWSGALTLPGMVFYICFSRLGLTGSPGIVLNKLSAKFRLLPVIFHSYSPALIQISFVAVGLWFLAAWWRNPEFRLNRWWLGIAAALFGLFLACPWMVDEASDLDIRILPFFFVALLASVHVGHRAKWLAVIPVLLFAARTADISKYFIQVQPQLAGLARSFELVPQKASVFPIVEGDQYPTERPFTHFWAYGIIRRGWFSPYLFDLPGQTPLRMTRECYVSDGFGNLAYEAPPDWVKVRHDYDYVWAYDTLRYSAALRNMGDLIYTYGPLEVYRIRK